MARRLEQRCVVGQLDEPAEVHHEHPVADRPDDCEVVADEYRCEPRLRLDPGQQGKNLLANGAVQRGHGLVANQHPRPEDQRPRNGNALRLPARQLVRIAVQESIAQADLFQHRADAGPALLARQVRLVHAQRLADNVADPHLRVQRAYRVLEHQLQVAPRLPRPCLGPGRQRLTGVGNAAGPHRHETEDRFDETRLARPRLADDGHGLPGRHRQVQAADRFE